MPITFGSVGDIISVCLLIKDIVAALNDCKGSAHNYQRLIRELDLLERVLLQVDQLVSKHKASPAFDVLSIATQEAVESCRQSARPFLERVKKYSESLKPGGSGNIVKDAARKVQWRALQKDEVDRFYAEVTAHTGSLNILLGTWSIATIDLHGEKTQQAFHIAKQLVTASDQTQQGLLEEVLSRIDSSIQISTSTNRTLQRALVFPRLKSIRQLGTTLMAMMLRIQKTTFKTYHTILSIQSQVCSLTAQCRLIETPSLLVDALGRRTPISPQFIDSWAAFEAVLKIRFEGLHGHPKVLSREYALQDNRTGLDLERDVPWHRQIIPGQEINMDVIFRSSETQGYGKGQCPGCKRIYEISDNKVKCSACEIYFTNVFDQTLVSDMGITDSEHRLEEFNDHCDLGAHNKRKHLSEDAERDRPSSFKRVRLCLRDTDHDSHPVTCNEVWNGPQDTTVNDSAHLVLDDTQEELRERAKRVARGYRHFIARAALTRRTKNPNGWDCSPTITVRDGSIRLVKDDMVLSIQTDPTGF